MRCFEIGSLPSTGVLCKSNANGCVDYHHEKEHHYLEVAGELVDDTATTAEISRNGMNTGLAAVGYGTAICVAGAVLFGLCL